MTRLAAVAAALWTPAVELVVLGEPIPQSSKTAKVIWAASRHERLIRWLATALPEPIAAAPERVLINVVCVLIGVAVLAADRADRLWPPAVDKAWAAAMIGGGLAVIVGYWSSYRDRTRRWAGPLERVGYLAILLASTAYGWRVIDALGWRGVSLGAVLLAIAAAKSIRLLVSSAARDEVLRAGRGRGVGR